MPGVLGEAATIRILFTTAQNDQDSFLHVDSSFSWEIRKDSIDYLFFDGIISLSKFYKI